MSNKLFAIIYVVSIITAIALGYLLNNKKGKTHQTEIITNTITDTLRLKDTVYIAKKVKPIIKKDSVITSSIDTLFTSNLDTIVISATVEIKDSVEWFLNIAHKDYYLKQIDTVRIKEYEVKEIYLPQDKNFYEEPYFNLLLGIVLGLLGCLL